jgi:hypothetical protein
MHASNVCTPIAGDNATIFVALELAQKNWLVTMHSPERGPLYQAPAGAFLVSHNCSWSPSRKGRRGFCGEFEQPQK